MAKCGIGIAALLVGILALALAIIPAILFDAPPPWKPAPEPKVEGKKSVEWHGIKFQWGGKLVQEEPKAEKVDMTPVKWFAVATAVVSVLGLALGPLAWYRERRYALAVPGMSFCALALTWQYVIVGIAAGVAAAVFLLVLSMLCSAAST